VSAGAVSIIPMLPAPARQHHHFCPDRLGNSVDFCLADPSFEELQIAALNADDGKARPGVTLANVAALTNKNFGHFDYSFR
jgi:hypothetical protein